MLDQQCVRKARCIHQPQRMIDENNLANVLRHAAGPSVLYGHVKVAAQQFTGVHRESACVQMLPASQHGSHLLQQQYNVKITA